MASPPASSSSRPLSSSRSLHGSQSIFPGASNSRPFLHMLNPMGRTYQGYMPANQSVLEEEDDAEGDRDLEAGHASRSTMSRTTKTKASGKRRVAWDGDNPEMNVLRPNVRQADPKQDEDSSDEEPQNFMIEASPAARRATPPVWPAAASPAGCDHCNHCTRAINGASLVSTWTQLPELKTLRRFRQVDNLGETRRPLPEATIQSLRSAHRSRGKEERRKTGSLCSFEDTAWLSSQLNHERDVGQYWTSLTTGMPSLSSPSN